MTNVHSVVSDIVTVAIQRAYPALEPPSGSVQPSGNPQYGDYKCNAAMSISKLLKASGQNVPHQDIANTIIQFLPPSDIIEKCEVARPGFINIFLKPSYVAGLVMDIVRHGVRPPHVHRQLRVVVDFSSPNMAKEMHIGHLRSTIIGETICRLLEFAGHDVLRLNHVGDWGTQLGMLMTNLQDKLPNYSVVCPPVGDLQPFYKDSGKRFNSDDDFKRRAYECVVKLQNGTDPEIRHAWKLICDVSRQEFDKIYERLDIKVMERGESFYQQFMPGMIEDLEEKGMIIVEEGRKIIKVPGDKVPFTVQKSDRGFTYNTSDLAAIRHRVEEEKADWIIYVVDAGQSLHFKLLFAAATMIGYCPETTQVDHVAFGVVLGKDKKRLKTRSGEILRLIDLLDEGLDRAKTKLKDRKRDEELTPEEFAAAQRAIAYGCVKYADLSRNRQNDYVFSYEKMLDDRGNTAVYLLYAYTRIRSIARLAKVSPQQLEIAAQTTPLDLSHPKELKLAKCIIRFPEVITHVMEDLFPHTLCNFIYKLCTTFTEFYDACYCIEKDRQTGKIMSINMRRLLLCEAVAKVLEKAFYFLGLEPLERM